MANVGSAYAVTRVNQASAGRAHTFISAFARALSHSMLKKCVYMYMYGVLLPSIYVASVSCFGWPDLSSG